MKFCWDNSIDVHFIIRSSENSRGGRTRPDWLINQDSITIILFLVLLRDWCGLL